MSPVDFSDDLCATCWHTISSPLRSECSFLAFLQTEKRSDLDPEAVFEAGFSHCCDMRQMSMRPPAGSASGFLRSAVSRSAVSPLVHNLSLFSGNNSARVALRSSRHVALALSSEVRLNYECNRVPFVIAVSGKMGRDPVHRPCGRPWTTISSLLSPFFLRPEGVTPQQP